MKNIICDIAIKNKYFGLNEEELIKGINEKLKLWKNMLNKAINHNPSQCFNQFKMAMPYTCETLQKFDEDRIKDIVNEAQGKQVQAFVYKDNKSANCNLKDYIPNWMKTCCGLC